MGREGARACSTRGRNFQGVAPRRAFCSVSFARALLPRARFLFCLLFPLVSLFLSLSLAAPRKFRVSEREKEAESDDGDTIERTPPKIARPCFFLSLSRSRSLCRQPLVAATAGRREESERKRELACATRKVSGSLSFVLGKDFRIFLGFSFAASEKSLPLFLAPCVSCSELRNRSRSGCSLLFRMRRQRRESLGGYNFASAVTPTTCLRARKKYTCGNCAFSRLIKNMQPRAITA